MDRLSRRVDRIEERLEPEKGVCLRWPNTDGTVTEVPGCRSLNDPQIAIAIARHGAGPIAKRLTDDDDGIRQKPTE